MFHTFHVIHVYSTGEKTTSYQNLFSQVKEEERDWQTSKKHISTEFYAFLLSKNSGESCPFKNGVPHSLLFSFPGEKS